VLRCGALQCVGLCWSVLTCCRVSCVRMFSGVLQRVAACCSVLQCNVVSVLQCIAVFGSVLQCFEL